MTILEHLEEQLELAKQEHGENDILTLSLKKQLARMQGESPSHQHSMFQVGSVSRVSLPENN
jgi:hypothetical protein